MTSCISVHKLPSSTKISLSDEGQEWHLSRDTDISTYLEGSLTSDTFRKGTAVGSTIRGCGLSSYRILKKFTEPNMSSHLWNRPKIQSESH